MRGGGPEGEGSSLELPRAFHCVLKPSPPYLLPSFFFHPFLPPFLSYMQSCKGPKWAHSQPTGCSGNKAGVRSMSMEALP